MVRIALACALLLLAVVGTSCGNGDSTDDLRIFVETIPLDGPPPAGLKARHMAQTGESEETYDLVPVEGGRRGEYAIRGGPEGAYQILAPDGWGDITGRGVPPEARRGRTPPLVRLGRAASLYVAPTLPTLRPGRVWGAERLEADGRRVQIPVEVDVVPPGFVIVLRFRPDDWRGLVEVVGRMVTGLPGESAPDADSGPLAEPLRITVPKNGGPVVGRPRLAATAPLEIIPVAAGPDVVVDGIVVRVEMPGLPIPIVTENPVTRGVAAFSGLPAFEKPLAIRVGEAGTSFTLEPDAWEMASRVRVLWLGGKPARAVRVSIPSDTEVTDVQLRPRTAVAFGRVAFAREDGEVVVSAPEGDFALLLRAGSRWALVEGDGDGPVVLEAPSFEERVRITGRVRDAGFPSFVRFFRHTGGEEAVLADGFEVTVSEGRRYEAHLPPGTYQVEVADADGVVARDTPLDVTVPSQDVDLPLRAPRR